VTEWTLVRIRDYYREHADVVAAQLAGREVAGFPPGAEVGRIETGVEVLAATTRGIGGFLITPRSPAGGVDRILIQLTPGAGTDVAVAATVALALGDAIAADGLAALLRVERVVTMLDGTGGLQLLLPCAPQDAAAARERLDARIAEYVAETPELATTDPDQGDGGVLVSTAASDPTVFSWAPYSLVPGAWPGVVMPLHRDDIAAASAGMPLEIEPEDVADRLLLRGDLLAPR
jgi:DNA primase